MFFCCIFRAMENIREIIGENLASLRKEAKLTQLELAEKFNYSIRQYQSGRRATPFLILRRFTISASFME